jgi:hypothetical protein
MEVRMADVNRIEVVTVFFFGMVRANLRVTDEILIHKEHERTLRPGCHHSRKPALTGGYE